jgi:hypothetical protein
MNKDEYEEKKKKTLFIDRSSSECGNCDHGAFPEEKTHSTRAGWEWGEDKGRNMGCDVEWEYVSTHYMGMPDLIEAIKRMRPDLEFWQ